MLCFHGSNLEMTFLVNDFKKTSCWSCSESDRNLYVWVPAYLAETSEDLQEFRDMIESSSTHEVYQKLQEGLVDSFVVQDAIRNAQESAVSQAAFLGKDNQLFVYALDIPDHLIVPDYSCPNMTGAGQVDMRDFDSSWIKLVYSKKFSAYYCPFMLRGLLDNVYFNSNLVPEDLQLVIKSMGREQQYDSCSMWEAILENWNCTTIEEHIAALQNPSIKNQLT